MSRGKDGYIGRWYSDTGSVPECIGDIPEYRRGYQNPPGKVMGHMGHRREANQPTRGWCAPHKGGGRNSLGKGAPPPFSFSYSLSFPLSTSMRRKREGGRILLGLGVLVGLPPHGVPLGGLPPPHLLYIRGQGGTLEHNNRQSLSRVRCLPPQFNTLVISS